MHERSPVRLKAAGAFAELRGSAERSRAGLWVCERRPQFATVMAYKHRRPDVAARLQAKFGLSLPDGPQRIAQGTAAVIGLGPRTWLFQRESGPPLEPELADAFGDAAAVTDQSDGYAVLRLAGPRVRNVLEKGVSLDLHDSVFVPGRAASTGCAHIGIILWRLDDDRGHAVFEVAAFRSLARNLWHFIEESAAEFGLAVVTEG
jgi:methylglutamate dehydrogenase subunit D